MMTHRIVSDQPKGELCVAFVFASDQVSVPSAFDTKQKNALKLAIEAEGFEAKKGRTVTAYAASDAHKRVMLVGLGNQDKLTLRQLKQEVGKVIIGAQGKEVQELTIMLPAFLEDVAMDHLMQEVVIATEVAAYSYDELKDKDAQVSPIKRISYLIVGDEKLAKKGMNRGKKIAAAVNMTRHLGNVPPSDMTPERLGHEAIAIGKEHDALKVTVFDKKKITALGMGCLLGVSKGSQLEPKFIVMEYLQGDKNVAPTVLVGKGITFDSGGLSIKPGNYMMDMKFDMLGAATVIGTMKAIASLGLNINVIGLVPTCENMPSGSSYRPDDILVAMNGKSVLIENTDAEGRLILADALSYAHKYKPAQVIDFATLTGACMVALGEERTGLFSPVDALAEDLVEAAESVGEQVWRLPVGEEYTEAMMCDVADIKNLGGVGRPGFGGASTAAAFLEFFTKDKDGEPGYDWAHMDLSCSHYGGKGKGYIRGGANGFGVETMVAYLSE